MSENFLQIFPVMMIGIMVFPLFWGGVVTLISYISGWQALAGIYALDDRADEETVTRTRNMRSLSTRRKTSAPANYSRVITYGVSGAALYISVMFLFRIGHKPLRIPFAEISIEKLKGPLKRQAHLTVDRAPWLTLILSMNDIEWIEAAYADVSP